MRREERFMNILGGLDEKYVAMAMPSSCGHSIVGDSGNVIEIKSVEDNIEISKKDLRIYWITRVLGMAAALALVVGGGVWLWKNCDKISVSGNESKGEVTSSTEIATRHDILITPEESVSITVESNIDDGKMIKLVCDETYITEDGKTAFDALNTRIELCDEDGEVLASSRLLTRDNITVWNDDIVIKFSKNNSGGYWGLVFIPLYDGGYMMTPYTATEGGGWIDFDPYNMISVTNPNEISFWQTEEGRVTGIVVNGKDHYSLNDTPICYDDETPYEWLYNGLGASLRLDRDIDDSNRYVSVRIEEFAFGDYEEYNYAVNPSENATVSVRQQGSETILAATPLVTKGYNEEGWKLQYDAKGSFNVITHTLDDGTVLIIVGIPLNKRFSVSMYAYTDGKLELIPNLFFETDMPLEDIKCDPDGTITYNELYKGSNKIKLDTHTLSWSEALSDANKAAINELKFMAGAITGDVDFSLPLDERMNTFLKYQDADIFGANVPSSYNTTVRSVTDGVVQSIGYVYGHDTCIDILDNNGNLWTYCTLQDETYVKEGDRVKAGDKIADTNTGFRLRFNTPQEAETLVNPMTDLYDEKDAVLKSGEILPSDELSEFSTDNTITRRWIGWADEWAQSHNEEYKWYTTGEFLDSLGVEGLKELYCKGKFLSYMTVTDNFSDIDGCNDRTDKAIVSIPVHILNGISQRDYVSSGFDYDSFYSSWVDVFTEEWALTLLNQHPYTFRRYGDELYYQGIAAGGDISLVHTEYELVKQTEDEIEFLSVGYHVKPGEPPVYDPALKDTYERKYIRYRFVKTGDGWRIAYSDTFYSWH